MYIVIHYLPITSFDQIPNVKKSALLAEINQTYCTLKAVLIHLTNHEDSMNLEPNTISPQSLIDLQL